MSGVDSDRGPLPRDIAVQFIPIVRGIALSVCRRIPSHIGVDDLIGAGFVGLVKAYRSHDKREVGFQSYAEQRIRGAMLDELRTLDPLTREQRSLSRSAATAAHQLVGSLGRWPTRNETAALLGAPVETLDANAAQVMAANPVMPASGTDDTPSCVSAVADSSHLPADEQINAAEEKETLRLALDALPPRLRQVLDLHYGEDLTLRDVGSILGVTESRASQLHHQALDKVRKAALHPLPPRASREIPLRFRGSAMALEK